VVAELPARPASAHLALAIDITSTAAVEAAVERAVHHLGGLDVLVNVAPADVAAAVAFLAYRDAGWITGHTLPVDGGLLSGYRPL